MREQHWHVYTSMCKVDSQWEATVQHGEPSSLLCGDLEGWDGGGCGKEAPEYLQLIHVVAEQKLTQYCKAIILKFLKVSNIAVKLIFPFKISIFASCILKLCYQVHAHLGLLCLDELAHRY